MRKKAFFKPKVLQPGYGLKVIYNFFFLAALFEYIDCRLRFAFLFYKYNTILF